MGRKHETHAYRDVLLEKRQAALDALGSKTDELIAKRWVSDEDQARHSLSEAVSLRLNRFEYQQLGRFRRRSTVCKPESSGSAARARSRSLRSGCEFCLGRSFA